MSNADIKAVNRMYRCGKCGFGERKRFSFSTRANFQWIFSQINMVLNVHRNHKTLLGTGRRAEGGMEVGKEGDYIPIATLSPPEWLLQSHFNVSLIVRDSHKTVSTDHNFWRQRRAEAESSGGPSADQPNALPLGQTGSSEIFVCRGVKKVILLKICAFFVLSN